MRNMEPKNLLIIFLFCSLIPILNQIIVPHFIFLGVVFIRNFWAIIINVLVLLSIGALIYFVYKKHTISLKKTYILYGLLGICSMINLIASPFFMDDISGFINGIFNLDGLFMGYIINQVLLLGLSVLMIWYVTLKKDFLK